MSLFVRLSILVLIVATVVAFSPSKFQSRQMDTKLYENFNLDFKNPTIESSPLIFTEKQLREFTATYSEDKRNSIFDFFTGLFSQKESKPTTFAAGSIGNSLKPTVSLAVLEEKTALFVTGKVDAKSFYSILSAAFGTKLPLVLPEILSNLPADRANALAKVSSL